MNITNTEAASTPEMDAIALSIFCAKITSNPGPGRIDQSDAIASYRLAEVFLGVRGKARAGDFQRGPT